MNEKLSMWKKLYWIGGSAAILSLLLIPIQIAVFILWPPPASVTDWFTLFQNSKLLGLLSFDLLYILNNTFLILIYLALYVSLRKTDHSLMTIAFILGIVGTAVYYASNTGFEMLALSDQYATAATEEQRTLLLAAGQTMLTIYTGTAFNVYYVLNAIALLIISIVMLKSDVFKRSTAYWGLAAAILMSIPSTAGVIGLIFSLLSLIPWIVFCILIARRFFQITKQI